MTFKVRPFVVKIGVVVEILCEIGQVVGNQLILGNSPLVKLTYMYNFITLYSFVKLLKP